MSSCPRPGERGQRPFVPGFRNPLYGLASYRLRKQRNRLIAYWTFSRTSKNSRIVGGLSLNLSGGVIGAGDCILATAFLYAASSVHIEIPTSVFPSRSFKTKVLTNPDWICRTLRKDRILLTISSSFPGRGFTKAITTNMCSLANSRLGRLLS